MTQPAPESERSAAARLTREMGATVTRANVRYWKRKGYPLDDIDELRHRLRMQERCSVKLTAAPGALGDDTQARPNAGLPQLDPSASLGDSIDRIKELLLAATDYETARTYKVQLEGLKHAFAIHKEQGHYVTRASQEEAGLRAGRVITNAVQRIATELPQAVIGLDYPEALAKCEDMVHAILTEISSAESYAAT